MKFLHIADLHLGKRLKEVSLIEDQHFILLQFIKMIDEVQPDALLLAGDIYDKAIPPVDAINLFDDFLNQISKRKIPVFIISGNHDSQDRMTFGSKLMETSGIHFSKSYSSYKEDEKIQPVQLQDEFGSVNIFLLPFVRPIEKSYTQAMNEAIGRMQIDSSQRNVLVAHQLVTGSERSDSEDITIGTLDDVDTKVFDIFDYVALGHIHKPQKCGSEKIQYSGSPLKYSFSEVKHKKGVNLVELGEKGSLTVSRKELKPMRDLQELKGDYKTISSEDFYSKYNDQDFFKIILTDEEDIPEGFGKLQKIYKNLLYLDYDNSRTRKLQKNNTEIDIEKIDPLEIFNQLYLEQNNMEMSQEQYDFVKGLVEEIWRGE